jgi:hypothetical protein
MNNATKVGIVAAVATAVGVGVYEMSNGPVPAASKEIRITACSFVDVYNSSNHLWAKRVGLTETGCKIGSFNVVEWSNVVTNPMDQWYIIMGFIPTNDPYSTTQDVYMSEMHTLPNGFCRIWGQAATNFLAMTMNISSSDITHDGYFPIVVGHSTNHVHSVCTNFPPLPDTNVVNRVRKPKGTQ